MVCSTEQTFIDGHGEDSAVLNIPSGVDYNPRQIQVEDDENMIILEEFSTLKQQPSSVMELSTLTYMEPLPVLNTAESTVLDYELTDLTALTCEFIDPAIGDLANSAVDFVPINQDKVEMVSLGNDFLELPALDQNLGEFNHCVLEVSNLGHDFNMDPVVECESPPIIYFPSTDSLPHVDEGIQEMKEVSEEILQNNPEQQEVDVASIQEPQPVRPRKRGRKPKGEPGAPRRRNRPKKVKLYEMNQFDNSEKERRRLNAINAKRHRCMAKDKMSKFENLLTAVTKERDLLKKEVEKLQRNEESLLMKLKDYRVVTVN